MTLSDAGFLMVSIFMAVPLSWCATWLLAARYRARMRRLMSAKASPLGLAIAGTPAEPALLEAEGTSHAAVSLGDNRRAGWILTALLMLLSLVMALSNAALLPAQLAVTQMKDAQLDPLEVVVNGWWPTIPALGLLWRWRAWQMLGATLIYGLLCFVVSGGIQAPIVVVEFLALTSGVPLLFLGVLCLAPTTRAIAPWLLPLISLPLMRSWVGFDLLGVLVDRTPSWLEPAFSVIRRGLFGRVMVEIAFCTLLPWLLAWWPIHLLGRALARAYARKWLSETVVLFSAAWSFGLLFLGGVIHRDSWVWFIASLSPLAWIPPVMFIYRRLLPACENRPPLLLVLRVFQHDAQVQHLFDDVIERWRLSGNTALIAGTDLLDRTLSPGDIFTFLDGGLTRLFIWRAEEVPARLAGFDLDRDVDGRFRVNKCYCHDSTWQDVLAALARRCDVVLMDLRGFQAHNAGCVYELGVLAGCRARVVALTDALTDKAAVQQSAAGARDEQFICLQAGEHNRGPVLQALFDALTD